MYNTTGFDPTYCSKTKYCMRQSVAQVTAGCNKQNVVFNNGLLELQPAVMLQFCNITAGCYLNHWSLHTIFCLLSAYWIKTNGMIYIPTVEPRNNGSQGTSCFFPVVPNSGVANLTIFDHD